MTLNGNKEHPDAALINGCVKGRRDSQLELYNRFSAKMFGICLRFSKDYQKAEDLLQEGFVKVYKNLHKFRGEGSFEGWIRRIFVNTAIEHYRKKTHLYSINELVDYRVGTTYNEALDQLAVKDLLRFINELSTGYRTVFNLYAIEGYAHKEVAEMLGISEGTSKSQLARARYILQKKILKHQESKYEALAQSS